MKKNKNILYLCECILLLLALLLIFNLYFSRLLSNPAVPAQKLHHLAQIPIVLLMLALVLAAIQRELLSRLLVNAFRDITGVHNTTSLEKKIQELNDLPSTFQIGIMMFDLNNLKYVNDTYGHEKGDEFIQTFTYCLTHILDKNSFLARYGGDEFILIQRNTSLSALEQMEQRLSLLVQDYNQRADLPLSYAVGYEVSCPNHYFMMDDLINVADKKMYQDKSEKKKALIQKQNSTPSHSNPVIPTVSSEFLSEKIQQIQKNTANGHQIALISTDVENFHYINDKYGYPLGNEILNIVFEELSAAPFSLFTARFFSDVFINIADTSDLTQDALLAQIEQLNQRISLRIQETYQISFFRTNSGICFISDGQAAPESIVSCANVARRIAKKMISHSCIYSDEIDRNEKMRAEILHSFHSALEQDEFQIYFQPKVNPKTETITSAEALVRWIRNDKMLWSPDVYIPLFEQNGFIIDLDYKIYEKAFRWLLESATQLPEQFRLSLNVSPLHFEQPQVFIEKIRELIDLYHIDPARLTFEITESTYVNNPDAVNQVIHSLQSQNIQISMDDFGSGYSSLNTLKDLLFDEVKIDRMFLGNSLTANGKIVLQEVFHMLKRMGKSIVCEGVETKEMADFLLKEGCNEIQGFLYYRPMCQTDFERLLLLHKQ